MIEYVMNIWQKKKELLAISSYHYKPPTIITLKLNLIIFSWNKISLKSLPHILIIILKMLAVLFEFPSSILKSLSWNMCLWNMFVYETCMCLWNMYVFMKHVCVYETCLCLWNMFVFMISLVEKQIIYNPPAWKTNKTKRKNLIKLHFVNKGMDTINIG